MECRSEMDSHNPYAASISTPTDSQLVYASDCDEVRRRMQFWNIEALKSRLLVRPLSDRESLPYLVAFLVSSAFACAFPTIGYNLWDGVSAFLSMITASAGTVYLFFCNGGLNGVHFLQRFFAIGWIATLRCIPLVLVATFVYIYLIETYGQSADESTFQSCMFSLIVELLIIWRIGYHIRSLVSASRKLSPSG